MHIHAQRKWIWFWSGYKLNTEFNNVQKLENSCGLTFTMLVKKLKIIYIFFLLGILFQHLRGRGGRRARKREQRGGGRERRLWPCMDFSSISIDFYSFYLGFSLNLLILFDFLWFLLIFLWFSLMFYGFFLGAGTTTTTSN